MLKPPRSPAGVVLGKSDSALRPAGGAGLGDGRGVVDGGVKWGMVCYDENQSWGKVLGEGRRMVWK